MFLFVLSNQFSCNQITYHGARALWHGIRALKDNLQVLRLFFNEYVEKIQFIDMIRCKGVDNKEIEFLGSVLQELSHLQTLQLDFS